VLHEAKVACQTNKDDMTSDAIVAEFGKIAPYEIIGRMVSDSKNFKGAVAYFNRGGDTFAAKAQRAVQGGAVAVVIGNSVPVWPYVMRDSKGEASHVNVPVIMVKQEDGNLLKKMMAQDSVRCRIRAKKKEVSCVVCTEDFGMGDVIMRLPSCGHSFHELCAMSWLKRHNTCPFCRKELPTDNEDYEMDRRNNRTGTTGSSESSQWESIFG